MENIESLKKNIISWYPIFKQSKVLQIGQDNEIYKELSLKSDFVTVIRENEYNRISEKYDYVVLIGIFEKLQTEKQIVDLLNFAKETLNQNGKILLAMQNKFGMKYWAGEYIENNNVNYSPIVYSFENILSLPKITKILKDLGLNAKFYYPLPDYNITNVIYTDEFMPDDESIDSRVLTICDENEILTFSEREAYKQLIAEEKGLFPFFSNSFFLEISNQKNFEDIRFVSFGISRNKEYSIKTVIKGENAYKTANDKKAENHINKMANNIKILNECNINNLDRFENHTIISSYLENSESLENLLNKIYEQEGINSVVQKIRMFNNEILNKLGQNNVNLNNTVFEKYKIAISDDLKRKLHFTKNGLYDLIFQNCLVSDNKFYIFDQEWFEENIPIEFILYRAIFYLGEVEYRQQLYQEFNLIDYLKIFEEIEKILQKDIVNQEIWNLHSNSVKNIGRISEILKQYENSNCLKDNHIKNLEKNIEVYKNEIDNSKLKIENLKKEKDLSDNHIKNLEKNIEFFKNEIENNRKIIHEDYEKIKSQEQEIKIKEQDIKTQEQEIRNQEQKINEYEIGIIGLRKGIDELSSQIQTKDTQLEDYANQLRNISNSFSWKLTKPIRIFSWMFNPFTGASFIDRIMPPGGKRRIEYDRKQTQKKYEKRIEKYEKLSDPETAEYWKGIDHRKALKYEKDLEKIAKDEMDDYEKWCFANTPTNEELEIQTKAKFKRRPKISIVIPLYNTKTDFFRELLYSVHCQTYSKWELCLADGSPTPLEEIQKMCQNDKRIKYKFLGKNGGISENTNRAIEMATGDFVALLDHDDMLSLDALYEVVKVINQDKNVEFIYSDEDKFEILDEPRYMPHFKPDFAPDTLRANNYICHFSVIKKTLLDKVGYFNHEFDGAQDFDLILRVTENAKKIVHISKILYHWRVHKESTAMSAEAKPYAFIAGRNAVAAHLERVNLKGTVKDGFTPGTYAVDYDVNGNPKVTILIPNKDGIDILKTCIKSVLEKTTYKNYEIVIIENNSENDETFEYYKELEKNDKIKIIYYPEKGFNYSKIINFGVKNTEGDFIVQLNNDTELLTPDWLEKMVGFAQRNDVGAVGVRLYYPDQTIQHAGIIVGALTVAAHVFRNVPKDNLCYFGRERLIQNMNAVTAACIMTKREIYEQIGYMNEDFAVAFNDIDFCLRIRKLGQLIVYNPYVEFIHYESKTRGNDNDPDKIERFQREINLFLSTWKEMLQKGDEYYNKNLRLDSDQYQIRTDKVVD